MAKEVRLLAIINSRIKKMGSFEEYIVSFARAAKQLGWPLRFIFPGVSASDAIAQLEEQHASFRAEGHPWNSKQGILELIRHIREFKPTLVNFHFCDTINFLPVFVYCRLARIPVVYHYHGEIRPLESLTWRNRSFSALRLLSWFWTGVITVSEANKRFLQELHVNVPIDVVYNGIDVDGFLRRFAELIPLSSSSGPGDTVDCLYIGSLIDRKRIDILLQAFALVKEEFPLVRLTIVGGGALEDSSRALAEQLNLNDVVRFTGLMIQYPFDLLKQSDILVSASESESFGLVFAEAMSFKLPVVACRVGGIPEVVSNGETGLLVEANNPKAFAAALLVLLKDPQMRLKMGEAGLQKVKNKFQIQQTIDATFQSFSRFTPSGASHRHGPK